MIFTQAVNSNRGSSNIPTLTLTLMPPSANEQSRVKVVKLAERLGKKSPSGQLSYPWIEAGLKRAVTTG